MDDFNLELMKAHVKNSLAYDILVVLQFSFFIMRLSDIPLAIAAAFIGFVTGLLNLGFINKGIIANAQFGVPPKKMAMQSSYHHRFDSYNLRDSCYVRYTP